MFLRDVDLEALDAGQPDPLHPGFVLVGAVEDGSVLDRDAQSGFLSGLLAGSPDLLDASRGIDVHSALDGAVGERRRGGSDDVDPEGFREVLVYGTQEGLDLVGGKAPHAGRSTNLRNVASKSSIGMFIR